MTKIMLVEDDKSLREIYGVRLLAEGYDIVSAGDGEEALAMAIKERPQLIISDVMMPKISGFDLLDILRSTTETRTIKVIMMTALSSENQRQRGEQLGADRYLVKSQVGIEDVVRVVHDVLGDQQTAAPPTTVAQAQQPIPAATTTAVPATPAAVSAPFTPQNAAPQAAAGSQPLPIPGAATSQPITPPVVQATPQPTPTPQPVSVPQRTMVSNQSQTPSDAATQQTTNTNPLPPPAGSTTGTIPSQMKNRVIQPINDPSENTVNLDDLLSKEMAKEAGIDSTNSPVVASTAATQAEVNNQIEQFATSVPEPTDAPDEIPSVSVDSAGVVTNEAEPSPATLPTPTPAPTATAPVSPTPTSPTPQAS